MSDDDIQDFPTEKKRKAEFIKPPNFLRQKVGSGGIDKSVLERVEKLLEDNAVDFLPLGESYMQLLAQGIAVAFDQDKQEDERIAGILYPAMQLKASGGMFHYPLISDIASVLVHFMEVISDLNEDAIEIVKAHESGLHTILTHQISGNEAPVEKTLVPELKAACRRYFKKYKIGE